MSKARKNIAPKKPKERNKKKPLVMTRAKLEQTKKNITREIVDLFCACAMDEFDWTDDDVRAFAERFERYQSAVDDHLLTLHKVEDIINDVMGISVNVNLK